MLVLVIIFGVLLCLSLIAVIVLAVWLHVLRTRSTTNPPDPPPTPRRPGPCQTYYQLLCLLFMIKKKLLRWYGHVQRATSCINSITRLELPGTRDRGRPRKTLSACVKNDMTICNLDGVNPLDRNSWRTSVMRCHVLPTPESGTTAAP